MDTKLQLKTQTEKTFEKHGQRQKENIKVEHKELGCVVWTDFGREGSQWSALKEGSDFTVVLSG
jgi:hypothetical protein